MNHNPPLTPEEAKNLTFPCLLEVWDYFRNENTPIYLVVERLANETFKAPNGGFWANAALPSPEITEAMRKQFAPESEYPKRMLVWDSAESMAVPKIVIADLGEKASVRYIAVAKGEEERFQNGQVFGWGQYRNAKPIPEPDPISKEIAELRQRLAELEAKHNQQSK
jgi:hypothetical protein